MTAFGPRLLAPRVAGESYRKKTEDGGVLRVLQENIHAQMIIKAFGLAEVSRRAFLTRAERLRERVRRVGFYSALVERSGYVGIMLLQVVILAAGAYMVSQGRLTVGALAAFQALFLSLSYSMASVTQYLPTLVEAAGGMRRIDPVRDAQVDWRGERRPHSGAPAGAAPPAGHARRVGVTGGSVPVAVAEAGRFSSRCASAHAEISIDRLRLVPVTLVLEDGDCFGERALLEDQPEHESSRTLTTCVFLTLNRATYLDMTDGSRGRRVEQVSQFQRQPRGHRGHRENPRALSRYM